MAGCETVEPSIGTTRFWVMGVKARAIDWDPIRGLHQGSGHGAAQTGRTHDLHPTASRTSDSSCNAGVVHT